MAWVRIDDHFPDHPKIVSAGPAAAWLYIAGLCYCNRLLTDGFIPLSQVDRLSPLRQDQDIRDDPFKLAERLCDLGLWHEADRKSVAGYKIHDYLKYQLSKKEIIKQRQQTALRQGRFRNGKSNGVTNGVSNGVTNGHVTPAPTPTPTPKKEEREKSASLSPAAPDPFLSENHTTRAAAFLDRYEVLYQTHRNGARYARKPVRDYAAAVTLCSTWADDARLDKLAVIFLKTDHKFAEEGSRTIPQFLALASWCDGKLAEHEAKRHSA